MLSDECKKHNYVFLVFSGTDLTTMVNDVKFSRMLVKILQARNELCLEKIQQVSDYLSYLFTVTIHYIFKIMWTPYHHIHMWAFFFLSFFLHLFYELLFFLHVSTCPQISDVQQKIMRRLPFEQPETKDEQRKVAAAICCEQAQEYRRKSDLERAKQCYSDALSYTPDDIEVMFCSVHLNAHQISKFGSSRN